MIERQTLRDWCMACKGAEETTPFGEGVLVYKVMGKMFAMMPEHGPEGEAPTITLKCDPDLAVILRATYPAVQPGYYMNKRHWNTITCDDSVPAAEVFEWIEESYHLVVKGLPRKDRDALADA